VKQAEIESGFAIKLDAFAKATAITVGAVTTARAVFTDADSPYTPVIDQPYIEGSCVMADPYNASIASGENVFTRQKGYYQALMHYPAVNGSPKKMREYCELIRRLFWDKGPLAFTQGTTDIDIPRMPSITRLPPEGAFIRCAVTIWFEVEDGGR
jgi:hypothetical protein